MGAATSDLVSNLDAVWNKLDKAGEGSIGRPLLANLAQELIAAGKLEMTTDMALSYSSPYLVGLKVTKEQVLEFINRESATDLAGISIPTIRRQIEYYFSDHNLVQDKFFNEKILESKDGYVTVDTVLKCQRLKNLKVTPEQLIEAIGNSEELEFSPESGIRRKNNRAIPPLKLNKKLKGSKLPEQTVNILLVNFPEESKLTWKDLRDAFRSKYIDTNVVYTRLQGISGHIGVTSDANLDPILAGGIEVNNQKGTITKLSGDELLEFWKANGSHFDMCSQSHKKKGNFERTKSINMGGKLFSSVSQLKNYVNSVLNGSAEGLVDPHYHNLLTAVFRLHPNYEVKGKNLKTFAIGKHPEHPDSKCFFIVKENGEQEDFSVSKCLQQL